MHESLPIVVTDLAYLMIVAGITTVLFKKLKQPLVLGYIVAGFLAGPNMPYTPTIVDDNMVSDWGQIGVIIIMFSLGLEFSFKKIVQMGIKPVLCACLIITCMMGVGNLVGYFFHWGDMDSMFLGGMLAMSSTTIIYKAYDELGVSHKHFARNVLSVLVIEDILGILLIVVLSTIAATRKFEGQALINSLISLGSVLLLWFLVGIFILPIVLKKYKRYMNQETLMIVSLALCFTLVLLSNKAGYSAAFGSFMMGSILAETIEAEQIEHSISSLKDFFGSIFFISVGMMVSPEVIVEYWAVIVVIVVSILLAQATMGTISYLLTVSNLKDSVYSGFSMAQIGEFAFIIAGIGQALNVTSEKLYPIVVSVSIITTFLTPYMIKAAKPVSKELFKYIGGIDDVVLDINIHNLEHHKILYNWKKFLTAIIYQSVAYLVLSYAFIGIGHFTLKLLVNNIFIAITSQQWGHWTANAITTFIIMLVISPFLRAVCMRKNKSIEAQYIKTSGRVNRMLFYLTVLTRFVLCCAIVYIVINFMSPMRYYYNILISVVIMMFIIYSRGVKWASIRIERIFKNNLHRREIVQNGSGLGKHLRGQDLHLTSLTVPELSAWAGHTLKYLNIGHNNGVHIASIKRGRLRYNIPGGDSRLFPGDVIEIVGDEDSIESFKTRLETELSSVDVVPNVEPITLKKLEVSKFSRFVGKKLGESAIREDFHCTVIGVEDAEGNLIPTEANHPIESGTVIWVVGEFENLELLELVTNPPEELRK